MHTAGNQDCHAILRGGKEPNYDAASVAAACKQLQEAGLTPSLMIDASHANSRKQHERQVEVVADIGAQVAGGTQGIFGVMIESALVPGAQKFTPGKDDPHQLVYGQSITDACLGWEDSLGCLQTLADAVAVRREKAPAAQENEALASV